MLIVFVHFTAAATSCDFQPHTSMKRSKSKPATPAAPKPAVPKPAEEGKQQGMLTKLLVLLACVALLLLFYVNAPSSGAVKAETTTGAVKAEATKATRKTNAQRSNLTVKTPPPFAKDELIKLLDHKQDFAAKCREFPTPASGGNVTQKCCEFGPKGKFQCLPNIVVLGAQKAGTTALVSYLLLLPDKIDFGGLKELHFFDSDHTFKDLRSQVSQVFYPKSKQEIAPKMTAESSPSYLADYKACPRMAQVLSPHTKYIVLLRNPVHRTWSDVQMKHRRLFFQKEFLEEIIPTYHKELVQCWNKCNYQCHFYDFMQCLPDRAGKHGRLSYLYRWLMKRDELSLTFLRHCLVSPKAALECTTGRFARVFVDEVMPEIPKALIAEARELNRSMANCCRDEANPYRCGERCFPRPVMMADVSRNHLFRSLYYPHLVNCLGALHRNSVLILNNEELRLDPLSALTKVFGHLDLQLDSSTLEEIANAPKSVLSKALEDRFPDFEAVNGWKAVDQPELKITPEVQQLLRDFFRPHNRRLFDLLETEPFAGWDV